VKAWSLIVRVVVAEYLDLDPAELLPSGSESAPQAIRRGELVCHTTSPLTVQHRLTSTSGGSSSKIDYCVVLYPMKDQSMANCRSGSMTRKSCISP
jgi:hypothetical protein